MPADDKDSSFPPESGNPFISFRRLIDDHISSAIRSLNEQAGIPDPSDKQRAAQTSNAPDEGLSALFNIFGSPPFHGLALNRMQEDEQPDATPAGKSSPQLWGCLLKMYNSSSEQELGFGLCEKDTYQWWRHYSRYSPENLIHDEDAPQHMQPFWHRAFLDLMAAQNDQAMARYPRPAWTTAALSEAAYDLHSTEDAHGSTWSDDQPVWNHDSPFRPYLLSRKSSVLRTRASSSTEEDMYKLFLAQQDAQRQAQVSNAIAGQEQASASSVVNMLKNASRSQEQVRDTQESPIIAMVTTSHTTTMPDGSSRTIRRFKKTFADGKEESSEDIQDSHTQAPKSEVAHEQQQQQQKKKKKGWFWN